MNRRLRPTAELAAAARGRTRAHGGAGKSPRRPMWRPPPGRHAIPMDMTTGAQSPSASPARAHDAAGHQPPAAARGHRMAWLGVGVIAAAAFGIEMAVGAVGVGLNAKWAVGVLAAALLAGFALTPSRALLRSRYLLAGAVLAAALAWPDLVWQAQHGWPNLAVFHALHGDAGHNLGVYWPAQILYTGFVLAPVWIAGLWWCLRHPAARRFRPAGIAAVITLVVFFVAGGKPYYAGGIFTFLFAAGAVPTERWLARRRLRPVLAAVALVLTTTVAAMITLSVLPARALATVPLQKINYDLAETIAWPREVALVAREYHALPPGQRASTAILAGNYGEAGAIDRYGPGDGLPPAFSGANNFWYWGPPPARDRSAIAINVDPALLRRLFTTVRLVAVFHNGPGVSDDEQGAVIYRATGLRTSWAQAWPLLRDFS